jgi:putative glutathione S-transferase
VTGKEPGAEFSLGREGASGDFERQESAFREWVTADGSSGFAAAPGRYHLYVSWACPWAHRTVIARRLKGLEDVIGMSVVDPIRDARGWAFTGGEYVDHAGGCSFLSELYAATDPAFDGRWSVPVLWDTATGRIVNNESGEILRMLGSAWDEWGDREVDLVPAARAGEIDALNAQLYETVNNAVYRAGFTSDQEAYERAVREIFATLDELDERLAGRRFLVGDEPTEADWRLFTTLVRFDAVYAIHFKCSLKRIVDYPSLWPYLRDLYQWPGVAETVRMDEIRAHYYRTHPMINPSGLVALAPQEDFTAPPRREGLTGGGPSLRAA